MKIEKLTESNYHVWKQKIELVLTYRDVDLVVTEENFHEEGSPEYEKWVRADKLAQAIIGLTLSDDMLEHVREAGTAQEMLKNIKNVFHRHTLLNKLRARREFYTVEMKSAERMLTYINRVRHLSSVLQSMGIEIDTQEMAMAILNGLPSKYGNIITALDALGADESRSLVTFDVVKSRLLQEEQRFEMRGSTATNESVLLNKVHDDKPSSVRVVPKCSFCGRRGHKEEKCWDKNPSMRPAKFTSGGQRSKKALLLKDSEEGSSDSDEGVVCLYSKSKEFTKRSPSVKEATSITWILDSGASCHMTSKRVAFATFQDVKHFSVHMGDKSVVHATGKGDVDLIIDRNGKEKPCRLENVLYVPNLKYSLVSISSLIDRGMKVSFSREGSHITMNGHTVAIGVRSGNLFSLKTRGLFSNECANVASIQLWHERLGHSDISGIRQLSNKNIVEGIHIGNSHDAKQVCEACIKGKMTRSDIPKVATSNRQQVLPLESVSSDVWGPSRVVSKGGARFFVTFIDQASRYVTIFPIKAKSDVFSCFKIFHKSAEKITGQSLKALHSDGGGEYTGSEMKKYLQDHGISFSMTCRDTPQQNGIAERMNRSILNMTRAMIHSKSVPLEFWADAVVTAAHIRNRVTSRGIPALKTPYQLWYGKKPKVDYLRVFGTQCWYHLQKDQAGKLESRANSGMFIGYAPNQKAYKIWDSKRGKAIHSRDVIFDETSKVRNTLENADSLESTLEDEISPPKNGPADDLHNTQDSEEQDPVDYGDAEQNPDPADEELHNEEIGGDAETEHFGLRRSTRNKNTPREWWKSGSALTMVIPDHDLTFHQATKGEERASWIPAINSEMDSLYRNKTWSLVPREKGTNILSTKWVFRRKEDMADDGTERTKFKARLVCRGFEQIKGLDYDETFAPVVKFTTLRMLLGIVAIENLELHQMDVKTAFLNGDLKEEIFMEQPEGFLDSKNPEYICMLKKALYGLKQAPRQWFQKIDSYLDDDLGFDSCDYDPCLYVFRRDKSVILIALYVDDLLIASNNLETLLRLKQELCRRFEMKDCGEARMCLGLEIRRDRKKKNLFLSQSLYIDKIMERFGMQDCKSVSTPMDTQLERSDIEGDPMDPKLYQKAIGSLMYLMIGTRPDLAFVIGRLSQHMQKPTNSLWTAVKRVFRYIQGTRKLVITYGGGHGLVGFSDSDWAGCKLDRKSTGGFMFTLAGGAIGWKSKKQSLVTTSTAEAEYVSLASAAQECVWLGRLYQFVTGQKELDPITLHADNQGSIKMAKNDSSGSRTKHIDIRYHLIRELLSQRKFSLAFCPTAEMAADILTKPLSRVLFERFRAHLGVGAIRNN